MNPVCAQLKCVRRPYQASLDGMLALPNTARTMSVSLEHRHYKCLDCLSRMSKCFGNDGFQTSGQVLKSNMQRACVTWASRVRDPHPCHKAKRYQNLKYVTT